MALSAACKDSNVVGVGILVGKHSNFIFGAKHLIELVIGVELVMN